MEKPLPQQQQHGVRAKKSFLKYLPKAASGVSFYNHPVFSPGRDKRSSYGHYNHHSNNTHSGPLFPLIPDEVRRKPRKEDQDGQQQQEPGSPKVSCIGQIKMHNKAKKKIIHSKKKKKNFSTSASGVYFQANDNEQAASGHLHRRRHKQDDDILEGNRYGKAEEEKEKRKEKEKGKNRGATKKQSSKFLRIFGGSFGSRATTARKCHNHNSDKATGDAGGGSLSSNKSSSASVPSLGQMRRFASGRQALSNFDWSAPQIAPLNDLDHHRNCHSDEELSRGEGDEEEDYEFEDDDDEVIIPFSAPILVQRTGDDVVFVKPEKEINLPKKEINLWQRRNTTSPPPLQLKPIKVRAR